jgi:hypothetical protein
MFRTFSAETKFSFIPKEEKEAELKHNEALKQNVENEGVPYAPLEILFLQMEPELIAYYKSTLNSAIKQISTSEGRGATAKTETETKLDYRKTRDLERSIVKKIIVSATNFSLPDGTTYPLMEGTGKDIKVKMRYCENKTQLEELVDRLPDEWRSSLIEMAQNVSTLTPTEKKS